MDAILKLESILEFCLLITDIFEDSKGNFVLVLIVMFCIDRIGKRSYLPPTIACLAVKPENLFLSMTGLI